MPLLAEAFQIIEDPQPSLIKDLEDFSQKFWGREHARQEESDNNFFAKSRAVILAYPQNEITGRLYMYIRRVVFAGESYNLGGLGGLLVHPRYRKQGMATLMLEKATEYFKDNGIDFALLNTEQSELSRLYTRVGFKPMHKPYEFVNKEGQKTQEATGMILPIHNPEIVTKILTSPEMLSITESKY